MTSRSAKQIIRPPYLRSGDRIGIVAPARRISREELEPSLLAFKSWGLEPVTGKNIYSSYHQFAGKDDERAADLQAMLDDDSIRAIVPVRGGYGTLRLIDRIDFRRFAATPKWITGYSDMTVLHAHVHHNFGIETIHSTMPISFSKHKESADSLRRALFGELDSYEVPVQMKHSRPGSATGQLIGGNLSLLYALTGSSSDMTTSGKILFIEDLDEYLYHMDRMMLSLKRSGKLEGLAGMIVGGMSDMKDNPIPFGKNASEIIAEAVKDYRFPVGFGFPAGHEEKNFALYFGREARLEVGDTIRLGF